METIIVLVMILFLGLITLVVVFNFFAAPVIKETTYELKRRPLVSVLIPARNEESNIKGCLDHALNQSYPNTEVMVLDDQSEDRTYAVVEEIQKGRPTSRCCGGNPYQKGGTVRTGRVIRCPKTHGGRLSSFWMPIASWHHGPSNQPLP